MTKARLLAAVGVVITLSIGLLQPAYAQLIGNYGGQRADGTPVSISVSRFRGQTYVTDVQVQANTTCRDGTTFDLNTFVTGLLETVIGPGMNLSVSTSTTYIGGSLAFDNATRSVSGYLSEKLSKLAAAPGAPTNSTICAEARQAFAAVLDEKVDFDPKLMTWNDGAPGGSVP